MADAGVRRLQPGIESLSTHILELMGKGTTMLQNIQALKWFEEYHIQPVWNLLFGFPGEKEEDYYGMERLIPLITHLYPPSNKMNRIELHRFSPNFNMAEQIGFRNVRPLAHYKYTYDLPDSEMANIAYHFDYDYDIPDAYYTRIVRINERIATWMQTRENSRPSGCSLDYKMGPDFVEVEDWRGSVSKRYVLLEQTGEIFLLCDTIRSYEDLLQLLEERGMGISLARFDELVAELVQRNLLIREADKVLSLATAVRPVTNPSVRRVGEPFPPPQRRIALGVSRHSFPINA